MLIDNKGMENFLLNIIYMFGLCDKNHYFCEKYLNKPKERII